MALIESDDDWDGDDWSNPPRGQVLSNLAVMEQSLPPMWREADGTEIAPRDMSDRHVVNAVNLARRGAVRLFFDPPQTPEDLGAIGSVIDEYCDAVQGYTAVLAEARARGLERYLSADGTAQPVPS
jgi:hypothetical protein